MVCTMAPLVLADIYEYVGIYNEAEAAVGGATAI